jgi:fructosamine-3-kinase
MNGCWNEIEAALSGLPGGNVRFQTKVSVGGGCINQAWKVEDENGRLWFVKMNHAHLLDMFEAESLGLKEMLASDSIRVPKPIVSGIADGNSYLVMEYISLHGSPNPRKMGLQLAGMHQKHADQFGWSRDNTIGSTPQKNTRHSSWVEFWKQERLGFQLELARKNGLACQAYDDGMELAERLDGFFTDYQPKASLLHGDLWGGNCSADQDGNPVIYDPAVYYGDREADLAMTELFGGFGSAFFAAYDEVYPIDQGYSVRKTLYNLYHILNHYNLFGGGYGMQATSMIQRLLAEV